MKEWHALAPASRDLSIAVNMSAKQLDQAGILEGIKDVLERTGLPPRNPNLEITETVLVEQTTAAVEVLRELRELGVRICLDDFGTG